MIPRIGGKGTSFKGAGMYFLHDKRGDGEAERLTDERVGWTDTHNLPTKDAWQSVYHMIDTANHADELKAAAGLPTTGRKSNAHVYTYSLAWKEGEEIENDEMRRACLETLGVLGMADHQAIFVRHDDTGHQHVHVIANRVCPQTGKMATLKNDRLKLSKWAEGYELERGEIQCEQRVINNEARKEAFVKHQPDHTREEWLARKERTSRFWDGVRADRSRFSSQQLEQRKALFSAKEQQIEQVRQLVKDAYKPKWAQMFQNHRHELAELAERSDTMIGRMALLLDKRKAVLGERAGLKDYFNAVLDKDHMSRVTTERHAEEKKALSTEQKGASRDQMRLVNKSYRADRSALEAQQAEQKQEFDTSMSERVSEFKSASYSPEESLSQHLENSLFNDEGRTRERERKPNDPTP